ncbi:MAG: TonB-dependent receptor, partial [Bacteroidales bacterium]|nr:TonB-dependent receptor [Bacteroidales bacterium]
MKIVISVSLFFIIFIASHTISGQEATLFGKVIDNDGSPIESVNIFTKDNKHGTFTNKQGMFSIQLPAGEWEVHFSHKSFKTHIDFITLASDEQAELLIRLIHGDYTLPVVQVIQRPNKDPDLIKVNIKEVPLMPSTSMNELIEMIKRMHPAITSGNELSTQYNVRGGNYDENLIYVNGIEILRPQLIRSGQQEGLSFVNPDMSESIWFSAGGFNASYGDKLSSVLDVTYKRPEEFAGKAALSLQGGSFFIENVTKKKLFRYLLGVRQKTNQYILNSLETTGEYQPSFTDVQTYILFTPERSKFEISFLGNYARNKYKFIPQDRETRFGSFNEALQFKVYFDGQEVDKYETMFGALDFTYRATDDSLRISFVTSAYRSTESETFDILGQYWLNELNLQSFYDNENSEEIKFNKGVGTFFNHARNYLYTDVISFQLNGIYQRIKNFDIRWGASWQMESIEDRLREWSMIDSAGFSLPHSADSIGYTNPSAQPYQHLELHDFYNSDISLNNNRVSGYLQTSWQKKTDTTQLRITGGIRANYWDFNHELVISPRATIAYKPGWKTQNILFRFSAGLYYQPPFYKELRGVTGEINYNIKAQKSIHFVAGAEWLVYLWNRPFKIMGELYYKNLSRLIPYEIDNVRIRYFNDMVSHGYATGADIKINGEFVPGVESWVGLSLMQTKEDIEGDFYLKYFNEAGEEIIWGVTENDAVAYTEQAEAGYKPRPTDQIFNFNLYFQDYLPGMKDLRAHINLVWGSRLPLEPPKTKNFDQPGRMKAYKRVDLGIS